VDYKQIKMFGINWSRLFIFTGMDNIETHIMVRHILSIPNNKGHFTVHQSIWHRSFPVIQRSRSRIVHGYFCSIFRPEWYFGYTSSTNPAASLCVK
jgi:hypothetical protein